MSPLAESPRIVCTRPVIRHCPVRFVSIQAGQAPTPHNSANTPRNSPLSLLHPIHHGFNCFRKNSIFLCKSNGRIAFLLRSVSPLARHSRDLAGHCIPTVGLPCASGASVVWLCGTLCWRRPRAAIDRPPGTSCDELAQKPNRPNPRRPLAIASGGLVLGTS